MKLIFIVLIFCAVKFACGEFIPITEKIPEFIRAEIRANQTKSTVQGRISYGHRAYSGQFPFAAWLHLLLEGPWIIMCGATLIKSDFVITAAHCFPDSFRAIDVWTGSINRSGFPNFRNGIAYIKHPSYNAPGSQNAEHDIGIIKLSSPVPDIPAYLPPRWSTSVNYEGQAMIMTGWGGTESGGLSQYLLYAKMIGTKISGCGTIRSENVICAKGIGNSENRGGDSGGPLLSEGNTLIGVVSFGWGGHNGYTRVDRYIDWIVNYTGVYVQ